MEKKKCPFCGNKKLLKYKSGSLVIYTCGNCHNDRGLSNYSYIILDGDYVEIKRKNNT